MRDADKASAADTKRLRLMQRLLRSRGYVRDVRGFWTAPDAIGLKPEVLRDDDNNNEEENEL